ncbi:MAG: cytochrome P450 [Sphingomonadaceae bacterium]
MSEHELTTIDGCVHAMKSRELRQALYDEASLMMEHALVNLHGTEHRDRRTVEAKVFRKDVFLAYEKDSVPQTLAETIGPFMKEGKGDLVDMGYRIMMNLTVDFAGIDRAKSSPEATADLVRLLKEFSLAPALGQSRSEDVDDKKARIREAMKEFDTSFLQPSIAHRQAVLRDLEAGKIEETDLPQDVLMALLRGQDKLQMSDDAFLQEGIFYVLAGAHTTIHSLTHAVHELLEWLKKHPEDIARIGDDPFFIQQCVFESVRLHPSSPVARRRALSEVSLHDGEDARTGDFVVANLYQANRDPAIFGPDADTFNPHRKVAGKVAPHGVSMGLGMHACLGRNLAIGVEPRPGSTADSHQYGIVPLIVEALLKAGIQQDPAGEATKDEGITRITWSHYPVLFKPEEALI